MTKLGGSVAGGWVRQVRYALAHERPDCFACTTPMRLARISPIKGRVPFAVEHFYECGCGAVTRAEEGAARRA